MSAMLEAAAELRDSKSVKEKSEAEVRLRELLNKYFEDDMKRRQEELKDMEARLRKLHEQLQRREQKMEEIVDLQMKVLVNQADGLGFFNDSEANRFIFSVEGQAPSPFKIIGPPAEVPIPPAAFAVPAPNLPAQPAPAAAPAPPLEPSAAPR
jgi:hypothetical protein